MVIQWQFCRTIGPLMLHSQKILVIFQKLKIPLWNYNSIAIIQQHLNIIRSTYELLTSDFVELESQKSAVRKLIA